MNVCCGALFGDVACVFAGTSETCPASPISYSEGLAWPRPLHVKAKREFDKMPITLQPTTTRLWVACLQLDDDEDLVAELKAGFPAFPHVVCSLIESPTKSRAFAAAVSGGS